MAQQGRIKSPKQLQLRSRSVQRQQGGFGNTGREQHQQNDMGERNAMEKTGIAKDRDSDERDAIKQQR